MCSIMLLCAGSGPAKADFYSGNDLLAAMLSTDTAQRDAALTYVAALADAINDKLIVPHINSQTCFRSGVTASQLFDVVKQAIENDPNQRDEPADVMVLAAFSIAFPCPAQGN